ncbi:ankyrin repeat, PH and SEC7 domain containing protein secG-like [Trichogramma pretiosum]|uniref:ankyrin repeat, PH and SEC7 domain containing protein secG-like n=1 Tax=Trichogramma pretiosum TaxID=7493 RepID=UPI0006C98AC8|nr:ankyrin repeat, PH and SEC7 domain containing protein secG-like [Trichogramma pretiosum]
MALENMRKKRSKLLSIQDMEDRSKEFCRMMIEGANQSQYRGEYGQNSLFEELKIIIKDTSVFPSEADAMLFALKNNEFRIVACLHERMAVNVHKAEFADGKSVLHWLVKRKYVEPHKTYLASAKLIIDYLLKDAQDNYRDGQGFTYFHGACMIGDYSTLQRFILTLGARVCNIDTYALSPLYIAAKCGREDAVRCLLYHGANPNWYDRRQGSRILHGLARLRRCDCPEACWPLTDPDSAPRPVETIVDMLVRRGARVDERNVAGLTPLEWAVSRLDYSLTRALLRHGASLRNLNENISLNIKDYTKYELMFYPVALYVPEMMALLTTKGFVMNSLARSKFLIFWSEAAKHEMDDLQSLVSSELFNLVGITILIR